MSNIIYTHHITPKSLLKHKPKDFVDHPSNLVKVTHKQHLALHKWLVMLTGEYACEVAYQFLSESPLASKTLNEYRLCRLKSKETRDKMSTSAKGKEIKPETKEKLRKKTKEWWETATEEEKNHRLKGFRNVSSKEHTRRRYKAWESRSGEEQSIKIKEWHKNENPENKKNRCNKISKKLTGRKLSEQHKKACKQGQSSREKFTCPTCGKIGHSATMIRWHGKSGEKCPQKKP